MIASFISRKTASLTRTARAALQLGVWGLIALEPAALHAQVPQLIRYEGRLLAGGTNFDGVGQFKFSLIDSNGFTTFWSHDGSGNNGGEPTSSVPALVVKGYYSVLLGDTSAASNMTAIPATVFTNARVRLRIWVGTGAGFYLLSPDQSIAPVGYALMASTVPDGAIGAGKISAGAIGSAQLAANAVTAGKIAAGAVYPTNLVGGTYVPGGGMIFSVNNNDGNLLSAGFVKVRRVDLPDGTSMYLYRKP